MSFEAAYLALLRSGELRRRATIARAGLAACRTCARACGVDRLHGALGACQTGARAVVCSVHPHFGEEAPLVGVGGSGTLFFAWCNLHCVYCQNCELSSHGEGREVTADELASMMLELQHMGCHNINLVSPSHVVPQILDALDLAARHGLHLPLVYNTGGYDSVETLRLLDGVVDIYMPDMKYSDNAVAQRFSHVPDYVDVNRAAVLEMQRQVGDLELDEDGWAVRGLLVRHLLLPAGLAGTADTLRFLAERVSPNVYLNLMDQYRPCHLAPDLPPLDRRITPEERAQAYRLAREAGLTRLDDRTARPKFVLGR